MSSSFTVQIFADRSVAQGSFSMNDQPSLFDNPVIEHGASRRADPETSVDAAKSVDATDLESKVVEAVRQNMPKGLTSHETAEVLNMSLVTVSPRFAPLARKKLLVDSGDRRLGDSGRHQIVWKIPENGQA